MKSTDAREWHLLYATIVLLVAGAFLYTLLPVLPPLILFLALLLLLHPFVGTQQHRVLVAALGFLIAVWLFRSLGSLLAPFLLALVIAYILDPLVDRLETRGIKRPIAVTLLALPLLALLAVIAIFGIPALIHQAGDVINNIPAAVDRAITWIGNTRTRLQRFPFVGSDSISRLLESFSPERLSEIIAQRQTEIMSRIWSGVLGVRKGVSVALAIVGYVVLVPVLLIYLLIDFDKITRNATGLIPLRQRERWLPLLREYDQLLSRYLRGQVLEAMLVGVFTWLGLWIVGFPYSGFVGAVAGVFNLVPYLGLIVSVIPALIISLLSGDVLASLLKVAGVFAVVQTIDSTITGPRIVGGSVGLHPVWVIFALATGSYLFGFAGLLLAMPAGVLLKLLLREGLNRYRVSVVYQDGLQAPET